MEQPNFNKAWQQSNKFKQFQEELKKRKEALLNLQFNYEAIYNTKNMLSTNDLLQIVQHNLLFHQLPTYQKENIELENGTATQIATSDYQDLMFDITRTQANWSFYLKHFVLIEDFEMAAICRDTLLLNEQEYLRMIECYYPGEDKHQLIAEIKSLRERIKETLGI